MGLMNTFSDGGPKEIVEKSLFVSVIASPKGAAILFFDDNDEITSSLCSSQRHLKRVFQQFLNVATTIALKLRVMRQFVCRNDASKNGVVTQSEQ
jgi:hypothetical protein